MRICPGALPCVVSLMLFVGCGRPLEIPSKLEAGKVDPLTGEAVENSRSFLLANPRDPSAWANLGMVLADGGLLVEARNCFENAKYLDPLNPRYVYLLGWSFLPDNPESAKPILEKAFQLSSRFDPDNPGPPIRLAETLRFLGKDNEARKLLESWQLTSGKHPLAGLMIAEIAASQGDDREARSLIAEIPNVMYLNKRKRLLGLTLQFGEDPAREYSNSIEEVRHLPEDPEWPDPFLLAAQPEFLGFRGCFRLAEALESKGRLAEAAPLLQKIWIKTGDVRARVGLVRCFISMGKWEEAKSLIETRPVDVHNPVLWACFYLALGDQFAANGKPELARQNFISGLNELGKKYPEAEIIESLGLRCRLLWRLESWNELGETAKLFLVRQPLHQGAKVFLYLSQQRLQQSGEVINWNKFPDGKNLEVFPETGRILKSLVKTESSTTPKGPIQP